jgi:phytoene/squalene synthetase
MVDLYDKTCMECSRLITHRYSTSFSAGIKAFHKKYRDPIYSIYGFVRFADEIVDTFHGHDKEGLLKRFREDTYLAIQNGVSLNPVLHTFQDTVRRFGIERDHIDAFLESMEMDLHFHRYKDEMYKKYIYGSAEVVGLMCLKIFTEGDQAMYKMLEESARSLGSAFQKINFLRDMRSDFEDRGRVYFPGIDFQQFSLEDKLAIEKDIEKDFAEGLKGIVLLPQGVRFGVYLAYIYYIDLFEKIKKAPVIRVKEERIRVNDFRKMTLILSSAVRNGLNIF